MDELREPEDHARAEDREAGDASHRDRRRRAAELHDRAAVFFDLLGKTEQATEAREQARRERAQADADLPGARERSSGLDD